tara:strand:+ start:2737 stop:3342 length:606 start_codon:yes stop_codon:yes gene_type:complete
MKKNYHSHLSFLDLLFNTLLCFAALFLLSFLLINPSKNENNVKSKADFIVTVTWSHELDNDVDTYVRDPQGNLVGFMRREEGLMHLDRDDLGKTNDTIQTPFGPVEYAENKELVTLRGFTAGEYIVNIHMYRRRASESQTEVIVQLDKLNPAIKTIVIKKVILKDNGDEKTAFRFVLNKDGEVKEVNQLPISLIKKARSNG